MFNTEFRINYSKYKTIDLEKNNKNKNSINYNEVFIPGPCDHRWTENQIRYNIGKNIKVRVNADEINQPQIKSFLEEKFGSNQIFLMLENHQENYIEYRIFYEKIQDAVMKVS